MLGVICNRNVPHNEDFRGGGGVCFIGALFDLALW